VKRTPEQIRHEQAKVKSAYAELFTGLAAEVVLKDLNSRFNGTALRKVNGLIDANATVAAAGCREVLLYIDYMMETDNDATTE
jgi:hypothetical protein